MKTSTKLLFLSLLSTVFLIGIVVQWNPQRIPSQDFSKDTIIETHEEDSKECYYDISCKSPKILFRVQTESEHLPPFACLNDISVFITDKMKRGFNIGSFNGTTGIPIETKFFDVAASDQDLIIWLSSLTPKTVIVAVSFGDFADRLSMHAKSIFAVFGAKKIENWHSGHSYLLIGQRGIRPGMAKEMITKMAKNKNHAIFEECIQLPLAEIVDISVNNEGVQRADEKILEKLGAFDDNLLKKVPVKLGKSWNNCGAVEFCGPDAISMHVFTGEHKDDSPKMCINGNIVFDKGLNDAGRGLNLAMVDAKTAMVQAVAHFDTYQDESKALEIWLDSVPPGFIVVAVSFDEASHQLSEMAKKILYEMGSSLIERIKFRASWYLVGHKDIGAYSPFEDMKLASGNSWAPSIKTSFCVPKALSNWSGRVAKGKHHSEDDRNLPKRHFCAKYDRHERFCDDEMLDEPLTPKVLEKNANYQYNVDIFNVPILVVAGLAPDSLRKTLSSLIAQEGLNTQMVVVAYDKEYPENGDLATLFHVKGVPVEYNGTYNDLLISSISIGFSVFKNATEIIVIEEDVTATESWLFFFSSILKDFKADENLDVALAFNPNGYEDTSGNASTVYRMNNVAPMYSYIIKKDLYDRSVLRECCSIRLDWRLDNSRVLIPAVSRVEVATNVFDSPKWLFGRKRTQSNEFIEISEEFSTEIKYKKYEDDFRKGTVINLNKIDCSSWKSHLKKIFHENKKPILVEYKSGERRKAIRCFGLSYSSRTVEANSSFRFAVERDIEVLLTQIE